MPTTPLVVDASTVLATKGTPLQAAAHAPPQRGERASDRLVDLNFKVPVEFRRCFKQLPPQARRRRRRTRRTGPDTLRIPHAFLKVAGWMSLVARTGELSAAAGARDEGMDGCVRSPRSARRLVSPSTLRP